MHTGDVATTDQPDTIEALVRTRLRGLRQARGWSLDVLGEHANLSPSTISRVETGKRAISLDVLVPLAAALQVNVESLLDAQSDDTDVVIRPVATTRPGVTMWPLSRSDASTVAMKVRLEPGAPPSEPRVHPGHDWFYVTEGTVQLTLGDRTITVKAGEAAQFSTMTPHAFDTDEGAELIMVFDADGRHAHLHDEG